VMGWLAIDARHHRRNANRSPGGGWWIYMVSHREWEGRPLGGAPGGSGARSSLADRHECRGHFLTNALGGTPQRATVGDRIPAATTDQTRPAAQHAWREGCRVERGFLLNQWNGVVGSIRTKTHAQLRRRPCPGDQGDSDRARLSQSDDLHCRAQPNTPRRGIVRYRASLMWVELQTVATMAAFGAAFWYACIARRQTTALVAQQALAQTEHIQRNKPVVYIDRVEHSH